MYLREGSGDVLLLGQEALPVLPEGPAGYLVDVEELVGRAADLRAPLLARVEFDRCERRLAGPRDTGEVTIASGLISGSAIGATPPPGAALSPKP
jgi:hypothetical protein